MSKKKPDPVTNSRFSSLIDEDKTINLKQKKDKPRDDKKRDDKPRDDKPRDDKNVNTFKTVVNSRFDFTEESNILKKANNNFEKKKNIDESKTNNFNRPTSFRDRVQYEINQKEKEKQELEKSLNDANSFPELTSNKIVKNEPEKIMNYIEKLTWVDVEVPKEESWIPPGFELLKKNSIKQKRFTKQVEIPAASPEYIVSKLCSLYEKWKSEYIEEYGYDSYEKNYLFEDHDYIDKLEELHQLELEEEEEKEREKEKEENDYYNEYEYYDD